MRRMLWAIWSLFPEIIRVRANVRRRSPYWHAEGVIFIHVPKAAGTSISYSLYGRSLGHIKASDILKYASRDTQKLYKFSFVRNPWDRAVSAYHFAKRGGTSDAGMTKPKKYQGAEFSTFECFVRDWLVKQNLSDLDPVFRCQSEYLYDSKGRLLVDYLGHVESISDDIETIAKEQHLNINLKVMNRSERGDYRDYYSTDELVDIVGSIYKEDVNNFGYRFER